MIEIVSYRLLLLAIALLPDAWAYRLGCLVGRARYRRRRERRWRQAANLEGKLGLEPTRAELVLRRSFELEVMDNLESAFLQVRPRRTIARLVDVRGLERLDAALASGKGAVLYSGHCWGNYTLFAGLGLRGYPVRLVRLPASPAMSRVQRWFHDRFSDQVQSFGCRSLWYQPGKGGASAGVAEALARNEIVIILIDLSMSRRNVPVRFFGEAVAFPVGPVALARETGAPMLDFFVHRPEAGYPLVAEIGPPFDPSSDDAESVQSCVSRLEEHIRRHPADWAPWHIFGSSAAAQPDQDRRSAAERATS